MSALGETVIHVVGDVFLNRPDPASVFAMLKGSLDAADVVIGNCEAPFGDTRTPTRDLGLIADPSNAVGLRAGGFSVMGCANNHVMDLGPTGLAETLGALTREGIATAGAGVTLSEARKPAVVTTEAGQRVAALAYACYFHPGNEATRDRPGVVPVRATTSPLFSIDDWGPGIAPMVASNPNTDDYDALASDIERARATADLVITSFHWGDALRPTVYTDHELRTARFAIDAGADAVFGHHHHVLRGVEIYRQKPIFYGLGHFIWDAPLGWADRFSPQTKAMFDLAGRYAVRTRAGYPHLPFHPDARMTAIARVRFRGRSLSWCGLLPCRIGSDALPVPVDSASAEGQDVVQFVQASSEDMRFPVVIEPDENERVGSYRAAAIRAVA